MVSPKDGWIGGEHGGFPRRWVWVWIKERSVGLKKLLIAMIGK